MMGWVGLGWVEKFWVGLGFEKVTHDQLWNSRVSCSGSGFGSGSVSGNVLQRMSRHAHVKLSSLVKKADDDSGRC